MTWFQSSMSCIVNDLDRYRARPAVPVFRKLNILGHTSNGYFVWVLGSPSIGGEGVDFYTRRPDDFT